MAADESLTFKHIFTKENPGHLDQYYDVDKAMIGEGSYGQVTKGTDRSTGQIRAIKAIDVSKIPDTRRFENEVAIQKSLDHPNIVKLYEVFKDARRFYLVMELCSGGELFDRIVEEADKHEGQAFGEAQAARIMQQILGAVHYMHQKQFVHRDIKPENFLMQNKDRDAPIKVIDFGLAKSFTPGKSVLKTKAGTPYYVAPQVLTNQGGYNEKCDIWSCGVLCYIILCGYPPFYGERDSDILKMVKAGRFEFPSPDWDSVSADGKSVISQMLVFNPSDRPSAGRLLEHPWFRICDSGQAVKLNKDFGSKLRKFTGASKLKKVALTLIAQHLKEEEIEELKATFSALDRNKDGTLSQAEIKEGMKQHNITMPADLEATLQALDTDGSGAIDYTEFIAATLSAKQYMKREVLWAAFRVFDTDGSGQIDREELKIVLQEECVQRVDVILKEVDLNGDGKISFDEFCEMMKRPGLTG
eukprot:CAMPEP_0171265126 /NCGR_PEP_ID=MMETSP0790-20130122/57961_1 /TAXON_ID=2925 /ORGANISM="Alexandrium catenella, Strain OF101" /LENGTH=471 /DNA_ID=CAMNT_0011733779 /DNA_START=60 /DNA_END=1475 /DNA_ORIENTATION=+